MYIHCTVHNICTDYCFVYFIKSLAFLLQFFPKSFFADLFWRVIFLLWTFWDKTSTEFAVAAWFLCRWLPWERIEYFTDKKENQIFLIYKEIQNGAVAKSYMTIGLLILYVYGEIFAHFLIYYIALPHIWLCNCSTLNFLIYEKNLIFFVISVRSPSFWAPTKPLPSYD